MKGGMLADPEEARALRDAGLSRQEIADRLGVSVSTASRYILRRNRTDNPEERDRRAKALDRLGEQAHGLALGCDHVALDLPPDPNRHDVELWLSELNRVVKSARHLRQKLREKLNDG